VREFLDGQPLAATLDSATLKLSAPKVYETIIIKTK